jgi:hypothetical protein
MFFLLSKSVVFLLLPSNILIVLAVAGAVLLAIDRKRAGTGLLLASIILLAIAGWWPTGHALIHALESRFPTMGFKSRRAGRHCRIGRRGRVPVVA